MALNKAVLKVKLPELKGLEDEITRLKKHLDDSRKGNPNDYV